MNRRRFLKTSGAATAAAPLFARDLPISSAAEPEIKHIVVVMMENRSFDHLLGWLPNANGAQAGLIFTDKNGAPQATHELAPDFTGCAYPDPDHSYAGGRTEINGGKMDGFLQPASNGLNAIGYYREADLPFRSALARNYTTCDQYFASILAPTFPNRIFQHSGATDRLDDDFSICTLPTIWDNLAAKGVSHKYYFSNVPFLALWGLKYLDICALYADFLVDCAAGTLPAVCYVEPAFTILDNLDEDDHPFSDVRNGDAFLARTFQAVSRSPAWPNTVLIVNYDEWGGFYDHVPPPRALAPNGTDPDLVKGKALLGCRVPCIVASPWTRGTGTVRESTTPFSTTHRC
jgi:phospholipase C